MSGLRYWCHRELVGVGKTQTFGEQKLQKCSEYRSGAQVKEKTQEEKTECFSCSLAKIFF